MYAEATRLYEEARARAAEADPREALSAPPQTPDGLGLEDGNRGGDAPHPAGRQAPRRRARPLAYLAAVAVLLALAVAWYFVR